MSLNTLNTIKSITEQREELLTLNNDLLYWVYSLNDENEFELEFLENVLTCYPNQLDNIKWLKDNSDITILNLGALRKWNTEVLSWNNIDIENPVLLSNWVIEFVEAKNKKWDTKKHLISTLRDWWAADELQRTTTAGRNSWSDLNEDLEREHIEESPFLWYDKEGNLALATVDNSEASKEILKISINHFLENKYLSIWDYNYVDVEKNFERNFPWVKYSELGKILKEIIDNDRINTYSSELVDQFEGLETDMKDISLWDSQWKYFVYFDKENNTIEYRLLRTITWFNDWFKPLSKRPSRLYLESENQLPRIPRIENARDWYVPTVKYFSELVEKIVLKQDFPIKNIRSKKLFDILKINNWTVNICPRSQKAIVNFLLEDGIVNEYIPEKYVNTRYENNWNKWVKEYRNNGVLIENQEGELLLDYFEANLINNWKWIELKLWYFQDIIDNWAPRTMVYDYSYILEI